MNVRASTNARLRGQPVLVLAVLLGGWASMRALLWETPFAHAVMQLPETLLAETAPLVEPLAEALRGKTPAIAKAPVAAGPLSTEPLPAAAPYGPIAPPPSIELPDPLRPGLEPFKPAQPLPRRLAAAHNMLFMAGLSGVSLPPDLAGLLASKEGPSAAPYQPLTTFAKSPYGGRWSADTWLLVRDGGSSAVAPGQASYGRSQAGGVLRFGLAPSSPHRPVAYVRLSQALAGAKESEAAVGLSARPIPKVPLRAAAELRLAQVNGRTVVRPAAYAVTELPRFGLPLGFTADAYAQAGYVGGEYASAFADGQVRAERKLFDLGDTQVSAGGGAWGGAQKGAARLDIGPTAAIQLKLGETNSRVSMDWRFRVAGDAQPASGPALTISAGF